MLYRHENAPRRVDPLADINPAAEPLLKPTFFLRYDAAHGETAFEKHCQSAEQPVATGETVMDVTGPGSVGGGSPIRPTELRPAQDVSTAAPGLEMPQDEVQISDAARMLERLSHDPGVRADRLARIQAEIASGTYETTDKLELAVERLLREIG